MSSVLDFGKHAGKTIVEAVFADPAWFRWALKAGAFRDQGGASLQHEAELVWLKARNIRIPARYSVSARASYYFQGWSGKFIGLKIVIDARYEEHVALKDVLDLGHICAADSHDRIGHKRLSKDIKNIVFGEKTRVTVDQLEKFFADPSNFDLPDLGQHAANDA